MIDVNTVILEDGIEYTELDTLLNNNIKYILLSNSNNIKDACIRKIILIDGKEYLSRLDSNEEFDKILDLFVKKNKALFS